MDKTYAKELALLERIKEHLESGKMAKSLEVTDEDELSLLKEYNLLTYKPVIYAANVSEDDLACLLYTSFLLRYEKNHSCELTAMVLLFSLPYSAHFGTHPLISRAVLNARTVRSE